MRTIGMLLGIPEQDQQAIRDTARRGLEARPGNDVTGAAPTSTSTRSTASSARTSTGAAEHPVRRPHDRSPQRGVRGRDRHRRGGSRVMRSSTYIGPARGRGQRDDHATHRLGRQAARRAPRPAPPRWPPIARLDPERGRGAPAVTSRRRRCRPATSCATSSTTARPCREGSVMLLLTGSANRDDRKFAGRRPVRHAPQDRPSPQRSGTASTSASAPPRPPRRPRRDRGDAEALPDWEVDWDIAVRAHTSIVRAPGEAARPRPVRTASGAERA